MRICSICIAHRVKRAYNLGNTYNGVKKNGDSGQIRHNVTRLCGRFFGKIKLRVVIRFENISQQ